ncbi:DUF4159 domain-containing protein [Roseospira visakhapatnamensis]|uniref:DUF4159 domain-containing protein n=1 Tax=Roseospira visakhapatnamensis TaxID=390880 RepID=A0A7W6RBU9_9PROT|nr:DUF4159 domain-containing protein [Roseospira visakhapatnamensis]MBB4265109.1 hypothetical protein [Roseospira visakhapatnamensis]
MLTVGPLALTAPWVLLALGTLPLLWWLMRATPPAPRRTAFPAVRLLLGLRADQPTSARTPWWLVLLRLVIATLIVLGLAGPLLNPDPVARGQGPLLLVVDDTWAAAPTWAARRALLLDLTERAGRDGRPVMLLPTAAPAPVPGTEAVAPPPVSPLEPMRADAAATVLRALLPRPWGKDLAAARARLEAASAPPGAVVWVHDGLAAPGTGALARHLRTLGRVAVRVADPGSAPLILRPPVSESDGTVRVTLHRPEGGPLPPRVVGLRARDDQGRVALTAGAAFAADEPTAAVTLDVPAELAADLARLDLEGLPGAGGVVLLDDTWARRPVGLVSGDAATGAAPVPLLDETHYLRQALAPHAAVREGAPGDLLRRDLSLLLMTDGARPAPGAVETLRAWVRRGGTLVRFAGPRLDALHPDLLPVRLRAGERAMGGALSWTTPGRLAGFTEDTPLAGLAVPDDVTVTRQVLAEPSPDLAARTWARLGDGTPLVTAAPLGRGRVVLVHVTADPRWSSLAMSGVFVDMLRRLVDSSRGVVAGGQGETGAAAESHLSPRRVLDGLGRLRDPDPGVRSLPLAVLDDPVVDPAHPPGLYGPVGRERALNLGAALDPPRALTAADLPGDVARGPLAGPVVERPLKPPLLTAALVLAMVDLLVSLGLRGLLVPRRPPGRARGVAPLLAVAVAAGALLPLMPGRAEAQQVSGRTDPGLALTLAAALETRLAWVRSGDPEADRVAEAGLGALTTVLARRTSAELAEPMGVDVATDPLVAFPLLYWPVLPGQGTLTAAARAAVNDYLRHGGMILIDVQEGGDPAVLLRGVDVPPLMPLPEDHVLTRSFYLLDRFPGRRDGETVWVERDPVTHDGVSSVVLGRHDWAGAWAMDAEGRPMFATVPGGNRQREMAYRFGVNVVLYALTGNYKGDQVHLPAIMERLTN